MLATMGAGWLGKRRIGESIQIFLGVIKDSYPVEKSS